MSTRTRWVVCVFLLLAARTSLAEEGEAVRMWTAPLELPTYAAGPDEVNPLFLRPLSYQGAQRAVYPYPMQENFSSRREPRTYKALYLENEYIKLCVLPELGGRVFYATDKTNDYEMFYRQHVIKPAHVGMLGAWISGGIEWCMFHHHRASTFMPVEHRLVANEDGSKTIWVGELERRHRMRWAVGVTLHPNRSYIEADVRMFNRTDETNSILYWANVATHVNDEYQVFFPPSTEYGVFHAKNDFLHWPIARSRYQGVDYRGVDVSWWKNHPRPTSIFAHEIKEGFLAGYDHRRKAGTVHVCNRHIVTGAKLWEWGPGDRGSMWDTKVLTDSDGPYAELMVGAYSDNQPDYSWIGPGEVKLATQYWYPLREMGGVKSANLAAAINLEVHDGEILVGANTTEHHADARLRVTANGAELLAERVAIGPAEPLVRTHPLPANVRESDLEATLLDASGQVLVSYRPVKQDVPDELPDTVEPPAEPQDIKTVEELYLTGLRIKQFHNARLDANDYFREALRRDPGDVRCNTQLGIDAARRGRYDEASGFFETAIARISKDYTRPRDCEPYYRLGLLRIREHRLDDAYDLLYRAAWDHSYRSAAYFGLAQIDCRRGRFEEALALVDKSLEMNAINTKALNVKSAILRRLQRYDGALAVADRALQLDPLDPLAHHERLLALRSLDDRTGADAEAETTWRLLADVPESYLELAVDYLNSGLTGEALSVLQRAAGGDCATVSNYPTIHYYLAYLYHLRGDEARVAASLQTARECSTDYCFPFRLETLDVLDFALRRHPDDALAHYLRGNLLFDLQPEEAIRAWEAAVEHEPKLAIAHRNLGWGYYYSLDDVERAMRSYERAIEHNPRDATYLAELDVLYERRGASPERRLQLFRAHEATATSRQASLTRMIRVLVLAGEYDEALGYFAERVFHAEEGNAGLHSLYVDACLLRGLRRFHEQRYDEALQDYLAADEYPENHQIGRDPNERRTTEIYCLTGLCYQALGQAESANEYFRRVAGEGRDSPRRARRGGRRGGGAAAYCRGLALDALGRGEEAAQVFARLMEQEIPEANRGGPTNFFAKFGAGELPHVRRAGAYYSIGLGRLGRGERQQASEAFAEAVRIDPSHVWARHYWQTLSSDAP